MSVEADKQEMKEDFLLEKKYLVNNGGGSVDETCDLKCDALKDFFDKTSGRWIISWPLRDLIELYKTNSIIRLSNGIQQAAKKTTKLPNMGDHGFYVLLVNSPKLFSNKKVVGEQEKADGEVVVDACVVHMLGMFDKSDEDQKAAKALPKTNVFVILATTMKKFNKKKSKDAHFTMKIVTLVGVLFHPTDSFSIVSHLSTSNLFFEVYLEEHR